MRVEGGDWLHDAESRISILLFLALQYQTSLPHLHRYPQMLQLILV